LEGGTYFVTFRLADSLPTSVVDEIEMEKRRLLNSSRPLTQGEKRKIDRIAFVKLEKYLDAGRGECLLREPRVAQIVQVALEHFNDRRYRLFAWCVMPNHVHAALKLFPSFSLQDVLQSWKSFTAKKANSILNRAGAFWQREYFDRLVRDEAELRRVCRYILQNPIKAGLKDWHWAELCGPEAHTTAGETPALQGKK
jgi:REP element-mobilizing transposase RayT